MTNDGNNQYLYDAEGRICAVANTVMPSFTTYTGYLYDAEGTRVAKGRITNWGAGCDTTQNGFTITNSYVLGPSGEQLTETDGNGNWLHTNVYASGAQIATYDIPSTGTPALHFQLTDWLGTRRAQTDIAGDIEETYTSLPYGDSFATQVANSAPPTADDATEHHFTGKERDAESGNDYFGARYYASSMGRFMSPDWSAEVEPVPYAKLDDPQSLNLYSYMRNNPLKGTDPDGHSPDWWQKFVNWMAGNGSYTDAELAQHRQWLMDHAKDKKSKDAVNGLTDQQVTQLYECGQNAGCMAQQNANRQAVEQAAAQAAAALLPDGLSRDATGKIHGDIPDQVPDNWTKEELKETESELKESIQRRKGEQQQLGEEGGHRERIRREEQLLRQVQKKLSGS